MNIEENTVLITGGSGGIGVEMAKQFLNRKNKVIITGRNAQKLQKAEEQLHGVVAIQSDVSSDLPPVTTPMFELELRFI